MQPTHRTDPETPPPRNPRPRGGHGMAAIVAGVVIGLGSVFLIPILFPAAILGILVAVVLLIIGIGVSLQAGREAVAGSGKAANPRPPGRIESSQSGPPSAGRTSSTPRGAGQP